MRYKSLSVTRDTEMSYLPKKSQFQTSGMNWLYSNILYSNLQNDESQLPKSVVRTIQFVI